MPYLVPPNQKKNFVRIFMEFPETARKQNLHLDVTNRSREIETMEKQANGHHIIYETKRYKKVCERLEESNTAVMKCFMMKGNVNSGHMGDQTNLICKVVRYRHPNWKKKKKSYIVLGREMP